MTYLLTYNISTLLIFMIPTFIFYQISISKICDTCEPPPQKGENMSSKAHPGSNAVDGDTTTWWQSPSISRGRKYNRVTLSIDLGQVNPSELKSEKSVI